jgi:hypothetical protein
MKDLIKDKPSPAPKTGKVAFDFRCPTYDERSSSFINAGTSHGVGYKNPVGHSSGAKMRVETLPFGRVNTLGHREVTEQN